MVFDKSFCVRQISVVEDHGIMLIRGGSSTHKDSHRIHVFKLNEFKDDQLKLRTKSDIRDRRIEKTRGCHLYTISKGGDGHLRIAVAVGRKMLTFQWKYSAAWTSWCSNNETETADGFIFLRVNYDTDTCWSNSVFRPLISAMVFVVGNYVARRPIYNDNTGRTSKYEFRLLNVCRF